MPLGPRGYLRVAVIKAVVRSGQAVDIKQRSGRVTNNFAVLLIDELGNHIITAKAYLSTDLVKQFFQALFPFCHTNEVDGWMPYQGLVTGSHGPAHNDLEPKLCSLVANDRHQAIS
jgi:hypothetical protein